MSEPDQELTIYDLFAGPGGWDQGVRDAGFTGTIKGFELDDVACATAQAAGHERVQGDIATLDPQQFGGRVWGVLGSPPCQGFSSLSTGLSRLDSVSLLQELEEVSDLDQLVATMDRLRSEMKDPRTLLVLEPLRWVLSLEPEWTAWEQVPDVIGIWKACAPILEKSGYSVETAVLSAEQYGVPQMRKRAILVARRDHKAEMPTPTHSKFHRTNPSRLDDHVEPWVSMADILGMPPEGYEGTDDIWFVHNCGQRDRPRDPDTGKQIVRQGSRDWYLRYAMNRPAPTITSGTGAARWDNANRLDDGSFQTGQWSRRVSIAEMAKLQTFPEDYPWKGNSGDQHRQVGDAVPPLLAQRIFEAITAPPTDRYTVAPPFKVVLPPPAVVEERSGTLRQNLARVVAYADEQYLSPDRGRSTVAECILAMLDPHVLADLRADKETR